MFTLNIEIHEGGKRLKMKVLISERSFNRGIYVNLNNYLFKNRN